MGDLKNIMSTEQSAGAGTTIKTMEIELQRLKAHAKALEIRNAELVAQNERLVADSDKLNSGARTAIRGHQETDGPLVVRQPPESSELTNVPQQQEQDCRLLAGGPLDSRRLITASKLLLNVIK